MKKLLTPIFVMVAMTFQAQTKNFIDQPYFETRVSVDTLLTPDRIVLDILLQEKELKNKKSVEELENQLLSVLKSLGLNPKDDLVLEDLNSLYHKYWWKKREVHKSKKFRLTVKSALMAGKVFQKLEEKDLANVSLHKTYHSKKQAIVLALQQKALKKAKHQADAMLGVVNQKTGAVLFVSSNQNHSTMERAVSQSKMRSFSTTAQDYNPIDVGMQQIKLSANLQVKFKIE